MAPILSPVIKHLGKEWAREMATQGARASTIHAEAQVDYVPELPEDLTEIS